MQTINFELKFIKKNFVNYKDETYTFMKIVKIKTFRICLVLETRMRFGELSVHTKIGILI